MAAFTVTLNGGLVAWREEFPDGMTDYQVVVDLASRLDHTVKQGDGTLLIVFPQRAISIQVTRCI